MKHVLLPLIVLCCWSYTVLGQAIYQPFDVDKPCVPRGGQPFLDLFLQVNLRMPFKAEVDRISGRVFLQGVVEPDGRITNVSIVRGLRPDCDREALRVFSLFNAWQPAEKGGQKVRQQISFPVFFKPGSLVYYQDGERIEYYNKDGLVVADNTPDLAFKRVSPVDSMGIPTGNVVFYKREKERWKTFVKNSLKTNYYPKNQPISYDTLIGYRQVVTMLNDITPDGIAYGFYPAGQLAYIRPYNAGKLFGTALSFYANGVAAEMMTYSDAEVNRTLWYPNGQIRSVDIMPKTAPAPQGITNSTGGPGSGQKVANRNNAFSPNDNTLINQWDSSGRQLVTDGKGKAALASWVKNTKTGRYTVLTETGAVDNQLREGIWKGTYQDGSFSYEEHYKLGEFSSGKSVEAGADTLRYTVRDQQPEFIGGMQGLGQFLAQNIRYPADAQRVRAQGRVHVSFVVCEDGSLCDYEVTKSVNTDIDNEALRVVKLMNGKWKPGFQRGKNVRVKYNLPVNFTLY